MILNKLREGVAHTALQKMRFIKSDEDDDMGASAISYGQIGNSNHTSNKKSERFCTLQSNTKEDVSGQPSHT